VDRSEKLLEFTGWRHGRGYRIDGAWLRPNVPIRELEHESRRGKQWRDKSRWQARGVISGVAEFPPEIEPYAPPEDLHASLANCVDTDDIIAFANEFGLLRSPPYGAVGTTADVDEVRDSAEAMSDWFDAIAKMKGAIELLTAAKKDGLAVRGNGKLYDAIVTVNSEMAGTPLQLRAIVDQPIRFESRLRPQTLRAFLFTQLTQALATGHAWLQCRGCKEWFVFREIEGRQAGRFNRRRTCSDSCRAKAYNKDREEARRLHAIGMAATRIIAQLKEQGWEPSPTSPLSAVKQVKKWLEA
jgi:hypothetical protein